jgi:hypothetical protein
MRDDRWPDGAYAAEFDDESRFVDALTALRAEGVEKVEAYTPYPVDRINELLPEPPSRLPIIVFIAGLVGGITGYWIQWFANAVSYPLNIGGRPAHATPAFFIPTFEATVLVASCTAFVALFALLRLPRPWHPIFEADGIESATIDHFWIAVDAADSPRVPELLEQLDAVRVVRVPGSA